MKTMTLRLLLLGILIFNVRAVAQNPLIMDQFTADPTARVFEGKLYLYPSHDILAAPGKGRVGWFCMEDYHVFSSENLTEWTDHGVIASQTTIPWTDSGAYSMWAPDCIVRNGRYYFYFPAPPKSKEKMRGMAIGVAIASKPYGPFVPEPAPIAGVMGIDPNVFIDKDGQAYLYWAGRGLTVAKLKDNMLELASAPQAIEGLPGGFKEGPFLFERKGTYYLTFPNVIDSTESLVYCTAANPMGPFTYGGVMMDKSPTGCWTNHQSIVEYHDQWYLFYHHNDLSPEFDKARSVRADSLFFNSDGSIRKVIPTWRGIGVTDAHSTIQIDRFSATSGKGTSLAFVDTARRREGWKITLSSPQAWVRYNSVDFGKGRVKTVKMRTEAPKGGAIDIRLDAIDGPLLAHLTTGARRGWTIATSAVTQHPSGMHNLVAVSTTAHPIAVDWITFE